MLQLSFKIWRASPVTLDNQDQAAGRGGDLGVGFGQGEILGVDFGGWNLDRVEFWGCGFVFGIYEVFLGRYTA